MIGTTGQPGLIPRLIDDLFKTRSFLDQSIQSTVEISYYEIYNEKIYDLLPPSADSNVAKIQQTMLQQTKPLHIREHPKKGPFVENLSCPKVQTAKEAKQWLDLGNSRRATACTDLNQESSRSHSIFQIVLKQTQKHDETGTGALAKFG